MSEMTSFYFKQVIYLKTNKILKCETLEIIYLCNKYHNMLFFDYFLLRYLSKKKTNEKLV